MFAGTVSAYAINPHTGALTPVAGSPFKAGTHPLSITIDPYGESVYVANSDSNNVSAYEIDPNTGALTPLTGAPFVSGASPFSVAIDPSNKFAYVANSNANNVSGFAIDSTTRALAPLAGAPFAAGGSPYSIAITGTSVPPCVAPAGTGTTHGSINVAETWTEEGSPHIVPFDINISAPVSIEACAVVRIATGGTITITPSGSMIALGAPGRAVTFEALTAGASWSSIRNLGGTLSLTHALLTGGGAPLNTNPAYAGVLHMQSPNTVGTLHVDDVEIADSASQGIYINDSVGFDATSRNLRIHDAVGFPLHVYARVIGSIPSGDYTGNGRDEIGIA